MNSYGYSPVSSPRKPRTRFNTDLDLTSSPPHQSPHFQSPRRNETLTLSGRSRDRDTPSPARQAHARTATATTDFSALQATLDTLQKSLRQTKSLLRESEQSAEWWKSRVKVLDRRSRDLEAQNKHLTTRAAELEALHHNEYTTSTANAEDGHGDTDRDVSEDGIDRDLSEEEDEDKENTKPTKLNLTSSKPLEELPVKLTDDEVAEPEQYAATIKSLIAHHWNLQTELALNAQAAGTYCECAAAKTIDTLLANVGYGTATPVLGDDGGDDGGGGIVGKVKVKLPPHPHPELFEGLRRERKMVLKRKVEEMRMYVEGLVGENQVLERILGEVKENAMDDEEEEGMRSEENKEEVVIYNDDGEESNAPLGNFEGRSADVTGVQREKR